MEQLTKLKKQVIEQINSTFPEDKKTQAIAQVKSMDETQFIEFLKQNKLIKEDGTPTTEAPPQSSQTQCIFCSIVNSKVESYWIDENKDSLAILEINPITQGHTIIIPKKHISNSEKLPQTSFSLAKKIAKKINTKFKPKDVTIASSNVMGHEIINVFPVYENETLASPRNQAEKKDLEKFKKQLERKTKTPTIKKQKTTKIKTTTKLWLPKRIP